jgi:23S rRNA (pseudouridine1915-N3)-methyltransferase
MNIKILTTGKISEKFTKEAVAEYSKRLSKYCKISMKECKNESQLLKEINDRTYLINVNSEGIIVSSEDLADKFSQLALSGQSDVTFIVSEETLPREVSEMVDYHLAISKFSIDLSVLIIVLYEQIYRGFRINKGEPYHK